MPMTSLAAPRTQPRPAFAWPKSSVLTALILTLAAFALRWPHFGDPAYHVDEEFYLLVGDRILHGALPYVDIWDRKPVGLFLIYAAARAVGGDGVLSYQLLATGCAAATAGTIARIARHRASEPAAIWAGIAYLVWIETVEGGGGQAPVFYNLPMALAAALVMEAGAVRDLRLWRRHAFIAMVLAGVAIQIKYSAVVEACFFGLALSWQRTRHGPAASALSEIALLALVALAPTLVVFAIYAALGHGGAFWFANFVSIFLRAPTDPAELQRRLGTFLVQLVPLTICFATGIAWTLRDRDRRARGWALFMLGWTGAALAGCAIVGEFYPHYLLPLFVPLAIGSAAAFRPRPLGLTLAGLLVWLPFHHLDYPDFAATSRSKAEIANLAALVPPEVTNGCMLMFDGPPVLYLRTHACTLSRFVFPDHLSAAMENGAIGVDPVAELRRVLAQHPIAIITSTVQVRAPNLRTYRVLNAVLRRDYRLAGSSPVAGRKIDVWVRR